MSTVADIMDELQDRIPKERIGSLFPALNRAIGLLAKRLYILESDLIIDDLSINIFAQISYEASTIAFVDGKSETEDTITDSASQFVTSWPYVSGFIQGNTYWTLRAPVVLQHVVQQLDYIYEKAEEGTWTPKDQGEMASLILQLEYEWGRYLYDTYGDTVMVLLRQMIG